MGVKIRPMTDLAKKMDMIEDLCISQNLPVYITKKGSERLVVLGHEHYEKMMKELENLRGKKELYESLLQTVGEPRRSEGRESNDHTDETDAEARRKGEDKKNIRVISG